MAKSLNITSTVNGVTFLDLHGNKCVLKLTSISDKKSVKFGIYQTTEGEIVQPVALSIEDMQHFLKLAEELLEV